MQPSRLWSRLKSFITAGMTLLAGRHGLIVGVANQASLATGIARAAATAGASLTLTYQNERLQRNVVALAEALQLAGTVVQVLPCDVSDSAQINSLMQHIDARFGKLDFLVHAVASAKRDELQGRFIETSRDGFALAMDISVYSLLALAQHAEALLRRGTHASVLTLTYHASQRTVPHYNVMGVAKAALESAVRYLAADLGPQGIRVNALSAGPVKTLSAAGIHGLRSMLAQVAQQAPLRRNIDAQEVGDAALFALSHLGRGTTGEVFHVDAGFHQVMAGAADLSAVSPPA